MAELGILGQAIKSIEHQLMGEILCILGGGGEWASVMEILVTFF